MKRFRELAAHLSPARWPALICGALFLVTLALYWPVAGYQFIAYDDPIFVAANTNVTAGLNWHSFVWAITTPVLANWHPVTMLSHIVACQLFGTNPGAHHLVNVAFHAVNALLLFLVLRTMTGALWPSAIVAAFFAFHPLRAESVAWVAERKDVLSAFFFLLTLLAYARHAKVRSAECGVRSSTAEGEAKSEVRNQNSERNPNPEIRGEESGTRHGSRFTVHVSRFYLLSLLFFALGLMSKPMLVTLPFLLLLLDFWPLHRCSVSTLQRSNAPTLQRSNAFPSLLEKLPFLALSSLFCLITLHLQTRSGAVASFEKIGFDDRLANAIVSYLRYPAKMVWPTNLAVLYPHPANAYAHSGQWPEWQVWLAALLLLGVSLLCVAQLRRRPYLAVGWFWYLGTMFPVIGLVQAGEQAMADRYTYLPLIGPTLALVWFFYDLYPLSRSHSPTDPATHSPTHLLRTSLALLTLLALAACLLLTRHQLKYWRDTVSLFDHAVAVTADNPSAQFSLGVGLEDAGQPDKAIVHYRTAVAIDPNQRQARLNLAHLLGQQGHWEAAAVQYEAVIGANPADLPARMGLADALTRLRRIKEAEFQLEAALRVDPDSVEALNNLAWLLATQPDAEFRNGREAVRLAGRACERTSWKQTIYVGTLAAAYAEAGQYERAVETSQKACALAASHGETNLLARNQELLRQLQQHRPWREKN